MTGCASRWKFTIVTAATAIVAFVLAGALPASAHAYILDATPAAGATLGSAPATVRIAFDEPVGLPDGPAITVVDASGRRVDERDAAIDPADATTVVVHLNPLDRGSYYVRWRVVSADTHVVHGTYAFGYGVSPRGSAATEDTLFDPSAPFASVLRWLALAGILAAAGALSFGVLLQPRDPPAFANAAVRQLRFGAALAIVATGGLFIVQSIASAGSPGASMSGSALATTLLSPFGLWALVRVTAMFMMLVLSLSSGAIARGLSALAAAAALLALTFSGHATAVPALGMHATMELADWLHLASTSAWIGGLGVLAAGMARAYGELLDRERRAWLARFTTLALPCALLAVATGTYASFAHEPHLTALLTTNWGVVLAIKIALVVLLLGLGFRHLRAGQRTLRFRRGSLFAEVVLAVAILLVTGILVGQSPPACMPGMPVC